MMKYLFVLKRVLNRAIRQALNYLYCILIVYILKYSGRWPKITIPASKIGNIL